MDGGLFLLVVKARRLMKEGRLRSASAEKQSEVTVFL